MAVDLKKWDSEFDADDLEKQAKKASENEFKEIPNGKYTVKIEKMELGETSEQSKRPHSPMLKVQMKIQDGSLKNQFIFQNFVLVSTNDDGRNYGLHKAKEFLRSLDVFDSVEFTGFKDFNNMILDMMEAIEEDGLLYEIDYEVKNGFGNAKVLDIIEK